MVDDNFENLQSKLNQFSTVIMVITSQIGFDFSETELQN
jgi:hypothetical protein